MDRKDFVFLAIKKQRNLHWPRGWERDVSRMSGLSGTRRNSKRELADLGLGTLEGDMGQMILPPPPPNSCTEALTPNVVVGPSGGNLDVVIGWSPHGGISALVRRRDTRALCACEREGSLELTLSRI